MSFFIDLLMVAVLVGLYGTINLLANYCRRQIQK